MCSGIQIQHIIVRVESVAQLFQMDKILFVCRATVFDKQDYYN